MIFIAVSPVELVVKRLYILNAPKFSVLYKNKDYW
jgi:hypothetical protein